MARDKDPDETKRPDDCPRKGSILRCKNMHETGGGFDGEQYDCEVCGASVYLDYEDMK